MVGYVRRIQTGFAAGADHVARIWLLAKGSRAVKLTVHPVVPAGTWPRRRWRRRAPGPVDAEGSVTGSEIRLGCVTNILNQFCGTMLAHLPV
jgi:hypothetical protein